MKKAFVSLLTVIMVLSLVMAVMAEEALRVKGKVIRKDVAAKSVTIKPKDGDEILIVMADPDLLDRVGEGDKGEAKIRGHGRRQFRHQAPHAE